MVKLKYLYLIFIFSLFFFLSTFVSAANCWTYNTSLTCTSLTGCTWKNDSWSTSGWCEELTCWSLYSQSACTTTNIPGKNCTWNGGGTTYGCEKLSCGSLSGTSANSCVNNSAGLNCEWGDSCYYSTGGYTGGTSVNCPQNQNQSSCANMTGCSWGSCWEKGCWSYTTNTSCNAGKDWNGKNCTWSSASSYCEQNGCWRYNNQSECTITAPTTGLTCEWRYNSCQEKYCYAWDFTNATACVNNTANLSCLWSGSYCQTKDCWSYNNQGACQSTPNCLWKSYTTSGWCNEINCWSWDSWNGGNKTICETNGANYGLDCIWSGNPADNQTNGWCYKNIAAVGCSNKTTERDCMDTFYCWWQYYNWSDVNGGGSCNAPGGFSWIASNTTIFNDWNPGCYIFDMNSTDCNYILGCNYTGGLCQMLTNHSNNLSITNNGLNCSIINDSSLCNSVPVLSSCCAWQNGSCSDNKLSSACKDQVQQKSEDSCEDAKTQTRCNQIAGNPWYMPCKWQNSTSKCLFKTDDIFTGNSSQSIILINNKMSCEAAGGKWLVENYCEGNVSIPTGRCEYKFDEEDNCDKACFACENKDSSGINVNATNAESACLGSALGFCQFSASASAPNGVGYCGAKEQFKKGIAGDCNTNCGDCTFKGNSNTNDTTKRPSYYCTSSKANSEGGGCKWITDNSTTTGGYCIKKGEKVCEDTCDRCKTQNECSNLGRTAGNLTSGGCKWDGSATAGSCVMNTDGGSEICWDGVDNNNNNLIDCADASCYSDSFCGFVEGNCFGWIDNNTCIANSCEWVTDKWGSWCDFKGSQCWKYNVNKLNCTAQSNCQWTNGTGAGMCEQDWSKGEVCMGLGHNACNNANASGCNWTTDLWCSGTGNGTDWCNSNGGWCDYNAFKPKNCWAYSNSSACNIASGCGWQTNTYSQPHCEVDWGSNCWQYTTNGTCNNQTNCIWDAPSAGSGWCMNRADKCWSYTSSTCVSSSGGRCYWQTWGSGSEGSCQAVCWNGSLNTQAMCPTTLGCSWKEETGWCQESGGCWNFDQTGCSNATGATSGCRWKESGYCDPKGGGFSSASVASGGGGGSGAMGADCYKYDSNKTKCVNKTITNSSCGWTPNLNPICEVDWSANCWQYNSLEAGCTSDNGCWFRNDTGSSYCTNIVDQCWSNQTYQMWSNPNGWAGNCSANSLCMNNSWGGCEPKCSLLNLTSCANATYSGKCKWAAGWCNPGTMNDMFTGMEPGASTPIGFDACPEPDLGVQPSADICNFGMKDMGDSYGFGLSVKDFSNASVCNKEKLSSFVMGMASGTGGFGGMAGLGTERTGNGNETVIYVVYLDSDGSTTGGCALDFNSSAIGYEFRLKYTAQWNASLSKAIETFNADKCSNSNWKSSDIKLSTWKKKMCSDIGGPIIAIKKDDLTKFPTLYDSTKDIRIYVATIGSTGNISYPMDRAGPGWVTPGSADFVINSVFDYGADSAKFEDILKKGFVQGEDCFNAIDDDSDGNIDCNDWDCEYSSKCSVLGVNALGYADTSSPLVTGVKIEEYPDSALIMYDTNKPTNGTLELYGYGDTQCFTKTDYIYDIGILSTKVPDYKLWHTASIYQTNETIGGRNVSISWPLVNGSTYNYKLRVCDSGGKCAVSKCSSFTTATTQQKCGYCNFVTRIKAPSGWTVQYDVNKNGTYGHIQGQVCGANAGMKTNYTTGRKVNIRLYKDDGTMYIEFLNASLTKTGLNDKVRTISTSGDIISSSTLVGLTSETRDKLINNLHPEVCRIKIPTSGACTTLYHCNDTGTNCVDRTEAAGGVPIDAVNCVWNVPNCEFSTYKTTTSSGDTPPPAGGGGGGGGGGTPASTYTLTEVQFIAGATKELVANDKIKFTISGKYYWITLISIADTMVTINTSAKNEKVILSANGKKLFDVTDDKVNDLSVVFNGINSTSKKASLTVKMATAEEKTQQTPTAFEEIAEKVTEKVSEIVSNETVQRTGKIALKILIPAAIIFIICLIIGVDRLRKYMNWIYIKRRVKVVEGPIKRQAKE